MKNIYDNDVCANNVMSCGEHAHGDSFKATAEAFVSDYEESDVEVNSDSTEERDNMIRKPRKVTYDPKCDHKSLKLVIGMQFEDGFQCKHAIQTISIENGHPIRFTRFNKTQCEAKCIPQCGWRCYGSLVKKDGTFVIKSLSGDHKCPREMNNKQATSEWIAREYLNKFRMRPNMSVKELELDIMSRFACEVTPWRLYKAKWKIQEKLRGSVSEHYGGLRRYIAELMKIDKEGRAARATYVEAYKIAIEELKQENEAAYTNFIEREPQRFCKAFISTIPSCDMIDNNISETFNGFIVKAREKHLIDMLESIHNALMERQYRKLTEISNVNDRLCPRIRKKVEKHKYDRRDCIAHPALGGKFQVQLHEDRFVVNMGTRSCTCRAWDLSGIPCIHACSAIHFLKEDVADYVADYYTISKYIECFRCGLEPINGKTMWPEAVGDPVQPPLLRKMPGRPKKKRRRAADENEPTKSKSARIFGIVITCKRCLQPGHNSRTCKNKPVEQVPREKVRRGRPSKKQVSGASEKMRATKRMSQPSTSKIIARERAEVRKGFGHLEFEGTGHIYTRMPSQKKVHFVNSSFSNPTSRGGKHDRKASVSGGKIDVVATQESRS
ncbi:hypothetical protein C2S51_010101 [Perilla frutescens var. frutescens]|nr:hypothetical protein C2S51_010101 [Perilla frutescens var. frutescens]